jgi:hypothetical protein
MGSWGSSTERMTKAQAIRAQNSIGKTIWKAFIYINHRY